jgi:hypothetical protein
MQRLTIAFVLAMSTAASTTAGEADKAPVPEDRFLWLEEVTGTRSLDWARARNAESAKLLVTADEAALEKRILEILDSKERIPDVHKQGAFYYNFWRDAKNKRGLWRRTTLEEYRKAKPTWETVLDLDALAEAEQENWVWSGATFLRPSYERCLIHLSRGGADADVVREFDVKSKSLVSDGFRLPEAKSRVAWRGPDSIFVGTDFGPGSLSKSGYPLWVKEWQRGKPLEDAALVFEGAADDMSASGFRELAKGFERDIVSRRIEFRKSETFVRRDGQLIKIETPDDANLNFHRDQLFVELRTPWEVSGRTFPAGALLVTKIEEFLSGKRELEMLFEPSERISLAAYSPMVNHIVLSTLDNVRSRLWVLTRKDGVWQRAELPGPQQRDEVVQLAHVVLHRRRGQEQEIARGEPVQKLPGERLLVLQPMRFVDDDQIEGSRRHLVAVAKELRGIHRREEQRLLPPGGAVLQHREFQIELPSKLLIPLLYQGRRHEDERALHETAQELGGFRGGGVVEHQGPVFVLFFVRVQELLAVVRERELKAGGCNKFCGFAARELLGAGSSLSLWKTAPCPMPGWAASASAPRRAWRRTPRGSSRGRR